MKNSLQKTIIYLLISTLVTTCGTNELKRDKQGSSKENQTQSSKDKEEVAQTNREPETATTQFFQPNFIEQKKEIENITEQTQDQYNEISSLKLRIKQLERELNSKTGATTIFDSPYSLFNQQIVLDNGTIYYGNVVFQDEKIVTIETLIGKLNLDRERIIRVLSHQPFDDKPEFPEIDFDENINLIEEGNTIYQSPAEIILLGNIAQTIDEQGNQILSGQVKNKGGKRADFVKINITLYRDWSTTQSPVTQTVFVDGGVQTFDTGITSYSSVEPKAVADFALVVPQSFGTVMTWTWTIDFEEY